MADYAPTTYALLVDYDMKLPTGTILYPGHNQLDESVIFTTLRNIHKHYKQGEYLCILTIPQDQNVIGYDNDIFTASCVYVHDILSLFDPQTYIKAGIGIIAYNEYILQLIETDDVIFRDWCRHNVDLVPLVLSKSNYIRIAKLENCVQKYVIQSNNRVIKSYIACALTIIFSIFIINKFL